MIQVAPLCVCLSPYMLLYELWYLFVGTLGRGVNKKSLNTHPKMFLNWACYIVPSILFSQIKAVLVSFSHRGRRGVHGRLHHHRRWHRGGTLQDWKDQGCPGQEGVRAQIYVSGSPIFCFICCSLQPVCLGLVWRQNRFKNSNQDPFTAEKVMHYYVRFLFWCCGLVWSLHIRQWN